MASAVAISALEPLAEHLTSTGFDSGEFSDIELLVTYAPNSVDKTYNLHKLIISRSPYLHRVLVQETNTLSKFHLDLKNVLKRGRTGLWATRYPNLIVPIQEHHIDFVFKWLYADNAEQLLESLDRADYFGVIHIANAFEVHALSLVIIRNLTSAEVMQPFDVTDIREVDILPFSSLPQQILEEHYLARLRDYVYDQRDILHQLPVRWMMKVFDSDGLIIPDEFGRYELLRDVTRKLQETKTGAESDPASAPHTDDSEAEEVVVVRTSTFLPFAADKQEQPPSDVLLEEAKENAPSRIPLPTTPKASRTNNAKTPERKTPNSVSHYPVKASTSPRTPSRFVAKTAKSPLHTPTRNQQQRLGEKSPSKMSVVSEDAKSTAHTYNQQSPSVTPKKRKHTCTAGRTPTPKHSEVLKSVENTERTAFESSTEDSGDVDQKLDASSESDVSSNGATRKRTNKRLSPVEQCISFLNSGIVYTHMSSEQLRIVQQDGLVDCTVFQHALDQARRMDNFVIAEIRKLESHEDSDSEDEEIVQEKMDENPFDETSDKLSSAKVAVTKVAPPKAVISPREFPKFRCAFPVTLYLARDVSETPHNATFFSETLAFAGMIYRVRAKVNAIDPAAIENFGCVQGLGVVPVTTPTKGTDCYSCSFQLQRSVADFVKPIRNLDEDGANMKDVSSEAPVQDQPSQSQCPSTPKTIHGRAGIPVTPSTSWSSPLYKVKYHLFASNCCSSPAIDAKLHTILRHSVPAPIGSSLTISRYNTIRSACHPVTVCTELGYEDAYSKDDGDYMDSVLIMTDSSVKSLQLDLSCVIWMMN